jgi:ferrous iron transport protein A
MSDTSQTLDTLLLNQKARIVEYTDDLVSQHLLEMGCLPGYEIYINNIAPLGDPISVVIAGNIISMRKNDAACVLVTPLN